MGIFDKLKGRKEEKGQEGEAEPEAGKYDETCALCGKPGTEKKWMGQYWHKKCLRSAKKYSKKMI